MVKLFVKELPLILEDSSLRAGIKGNSSWAVRNISIEIDKNREEKKEVWEEKLESLEKERKNLNVEIRSAEEQIKLVKGWMNIAYLPAKIKALKELYKEEKKETILLHLIPCLYFIKTCRDYLEKLHSKEEDLRWKHYKTLKEIENIREILRSPFYGEKHLNPLKLFHKNLEITLRCMDRREVFPEEIEISYITPGSYWIPLYKLYIYDNYKKIRLVAGAQVAQKSGEDWDKAKLSFSSALIERKTQLPDLPAKCIGKSQPLKPVSFRRRTLSSADRYKSYYEWLATAKEDISRRTSPYQELIDKCSEKYNELKNIPPVPAYQIPPVSTSVCNVKSPTGVLQERDEMICPPPFPAGVVCDALNYRQEEVCHTMDLKSGQPLKPSAPRRGMIKVDLLPSERKRTFMDGIGHVIAGAGATFADVLQDRDEDRELLTSPVIETVKMPDYLKYELTGIEETSWEYRGLLKMTKTLTVAEDISVSEETLLQAIREAENFARIPVFEYGEESFHFVLEGRGRANIPSDGLSHTVDLIAEECESSLEYVSAPQSEPKVFRRIVMSNPFNNPLPSGSVQVFTDNAYTMTTELGSTGKGGKAIFPLGVEENIKISRNTSFYQEEKGIVGGISSAQHMVEISVKSHVAEAVSLEVSERLPVISPDEKDIKIKILKSDPEGKKIEPVKGEKNAGLYSWKIDVSPGSSENIKLEYEILIPAKMEISGGNRRV